MPALGRVVGHDAVDADGREQQGQAGEQGEQQEREAPLGAGIGDHLFHRHDAEDRLLGVHLPDRPRHRGSQPPPGHPRCARGTPSPGRESAGWRETSPPAAAGPAPPGARHRPPRRSWPWDPPGPNSWTRRSIGSSPGQYLPAIVWLITTSTGPRRIDHRREGAAPPDGDLHRLEVLGRHLSPLGHRRRLVGRGRPALDLEASVTPAAVGQPAHQRHLPDARHLRHRGLGAIVERAPLRVGEIAALGRARSAPAARPAAPAGARG